MSSEKVFAKRRLSEHEKQLIMGNVEGNLPKAILKSRPRETSVALARGDGRRWKRKSESEVRS